MSRPEFRRAWRLLLPHVEAVSHDPGVDDAAVVAVLIRFAAQLHVHASAEKVRDITEMGELFVTVAQNCFSQTIEDAVRLSKDSGSS